MQNISVISYSTKWTWPKKMRKREYCTEILLTIHDHFRPYLDYPRPFNNDPDLSRLCPDRDKPSSQRGLEFTAPSYEIRNNYKHNTEGKKNLDVSSQKKWRGNVWEDCRSKFGEDWTREEDLEEIKGREGVWSVRKGKKIWKIERSGKTGRGREKSGTGDLARMEGEKFETNWRAECGGCKLGKDERKVSAILIAGRRTFLGR